MARPDSEMSYRFPTSQLVIPQRENLHRLREIDTIMPPLIRIPDTLNPFRSEGVIIYMKDMTEMPLGNSKTGPAVNMLRRLHEEGRLKGKRGIVEASSGNTGRGLAAVVQEHGEFGIDEVIVYVSQGTPEPKQQSIRHYGATVIETPDGMELAQEMGKKETYINPDQYNNPANPEYFEQVTGPQIWSQTIGKIRLFCAGIGTGGTFTGVMRFLKRQNPGIHGLSVIVGSGDIPGIRTRERLKKIGNPWKDYADGIQEVTEEDAFLMNLRMIEEGLMVGPSSGAALKGLEQELHALRAQGKLDSLRSKNGEISAVIFAADGFEMYQDKYSRTLKTAS